MKKKLGIGIGSVAILITVVIAMMTGKGDSDNTKPEGVETQSSVVRGLTNEEKAQVSMLAKKVGTQMSVNSYLAKEYMQEHGGVYDSRKTSVNMTHGMNKADAFECQMIDEVAGETSYFKFGDKVISGIIMPGMDGTIVEEEWCEYMVPQGVTYSDGYFFITAYCSKDNHRSVIYVVDAETKAYVTTLVRNEVSHSGGITIANGYMWLCDGSYQMKYYDFSEIKSIIRDDLQSIDLSEITQGTVEIDNKASYCTTYGEYLCVGSFNEKDANQIMLYKPNVEAEKLPFVSSVERLPVNTQGALFYKGGEKDYLLVTSSYGRWNVSKYHSRLYIYEINNTNTVIDSVKHVRTFVLPPMVEEVALHEGVLYFVFESCAATYKNWGASPVIAKLCGFDCHFIFE